MTPPTTATTTDTTTDTDRAVAALTHATNIVVTVSIDSLSAANTPITQSQLRLLLILRDRAHTNLAALAGELGVHSSNASRACDSLVAAGLLHRTAAPASRRNLALSLTETGHTVLTTVLAYRRDTLTAILARIHPTHRARLSATLEAFADAATDITTTPAASARHPRSTRH
jgi:DNA-binding MarR family transcriptional regulator